MIDPNPTEEMIRTAQSATECEPSECDDCMTKAVAAVIDIINRDHRTEEATR